MAGRARGEVSAGLGAWAGGGKQHWVWGCISIWVSQSRGCGGGELTVACGMDWSDETSGTGAAGSTAGWVGSTSIVPVASLTPTRSHECLTGKRRGLGWAAGERRSAAGTEATVVIRCNGRCAGMGAVVKRRAGVGRTKRSIGVVNEVF